MVEQVKSVLTETQIPPHCLELEITETAMSTHTHKAIQIFSELQQLGIQIAIDDFGTGYSSLAFLKDIPIHTLKIDKSFLEDLMVFSKNRVILQSIIDLGHRLKLKIIAEGIETQEQLTILKMLNCDYGQGYLLSRPLNLEGINEYLNIKRSPFSPLENGCPI